MPEQNRSSGGAGVGGSYGPSDQLQPANNSSGNAADPSDPRPHITRSSGGAGVEGTYGPDTTLNSSKQGSKQSSQQQSATQSAQKDDTAGRNERKQTSTPEAMGKEGGADAGLAAEENLPDPMVAADDGSSNLHPRSKL